MAAALRGLKSTEHSMQHLPKHRLAEIQGDDLWLHDFGSELFWAIFGQQTRGQ